jgi:hypothetical protein
MSHSPEQPEGAERGAHDCTPMWAELPAAQGRAMRVVAGRRGAEAGGDNKNPSREHPAFVHHGNATSESTHSGSESTPTEQTDQTESDDMLVRALYNTHTHTHLAGKPTPPCPNIHC